MRGLMAVAVLALTACGPPVDRQAMKQSRQAIKLCDAMLAKGGTTIAECLKLRKQYEERFGRRY